MNLLFSIRVYVKECDPKKGFPSVEPLDVTTCHVLVTPTTLELAAILHTEELLELEILPLVCGSL